MPDMKKVIIGLEKCISDDECHQDDCPYYAHEETGLCWDILAADALTLLKEQDEEIENLKQTAQSMMEGLVVMHG